MRTTEEKLMNILRGEIWLAFMERTRNAVLLVFFSFSFFDTGESGRRQRETRTRAKEQMARR